MSVPLHRCTREHPYRPTDWRWRRARFLRENKLRGLSRRQDDADVLAARRFQAAVEKCENELNLYRLMEKTGDLFLAYDMWYQDEEQGDSPGGAHPARYDLEASILARKPFAEIAKSLDVSPRVVDLYERMFFNVTDRLDNVGYVFHQVLGPAMHRGMTDRQYDLLWKFVGYTHGPRALEYFVATETNPVWVERPEQMQALYVDGAKSAMRRKSYVAARTLPINSYTQIQILELQAKLVELEQGGESAKAEQLIMQNIESAICAVPWAVGKDVSDRMDEKLRLHYDTSSAAELRADEVLVLGQGQDVNTLDGIKNMKLPDKPEDAR